MNDSLSWLLHSDAGLAVRIAIGVAILGVFAVVDLRRHGRSARRWREYLFLVACVFIALAYGFVNDQLTVWISWEYFYYGKDLMGALGPETPPAEWPLRWEAMKVGAKATWSAGLILGVILLIANNPSPKLAPLTFGRLFAYLPFLLIVTVSFAIVLGAIGSLGGLTWVTNEFDLLVREDLWRPRRFMGVYGIHLGGYIGGFVGAMVVAYRIRRERKRRAVEIAPAAEKPTP